MVACLDWGLGHATRCIPLIKCLSENGFSIIFAGNKQAETIIQEAFPSVLFLPLKGYEIAYPQKKRFLPIKILWQTPKILLSILRENKWLQQAIKNHGIDIVISDNRYGLFSNKAYCIFMTHQLRIQAKYVWLENILQKINYRFINRFSACWVVDSAIHVQHNINSADLLRISHRYSSRQPLRSWSYHRYPGCT